MNNQPDQPFIALFQEQATVRLMNVYKGLPISNDAVITRILSNYICVSSIKAQIVCMFLDRETFIQSPTLPQIIRADVLKCDAEQMEVWLGNFSLTNGSIGERKQVRVEPVDMVNSFVQPKNLRGLVKAELADISQNGIAIYLPRSFFTADVFKIGAEMIVHLSLPATNTAAIYSAYNAPRGSDLSSRFNRDSLRGINDMGTYSGNDSDFRKDTPSVSDGKLVLRTLIRNIRPEHTRSRVRIGMSLFPNLEAQAFISNFITQRQSELVREVKTLYDLLNKSE